MDTFIMGQSSNSYKSPRQDQAALLNHARAYAARGWSIIPTRGKKAAGRWKRFQSVPPDEAALRMLFTAPDVNGLAVVLGSASDDLCCRDWDDLTSYEHWARMHPQLAASLPTVETARGRHVYFRGPERFEDFGDGEYRGDSGHFCLLPPSKHPSGHVYAWINPLPAGSLPTIDPHLGGFCQSWDATERTERTEKTERTERNVENTYNSTTSLSSQLSLLQASENAIANSLPTRPGERKRHLFKLCRRLKAIPALASAKPAALRPIVVEWHGRALPVIATKPFLETWADFLQAWRKVQFPDGHGAIETAFQRALASVPPPAARKLYGEGPIVLLAALCRELQRIVGDGEFYLDCRTAGRLIGTDHTTAWRYLDVLCADGILASGAKGSQATHKASRFRFIGTEQE